MSATRLWYNDPHPANHPSCSADRAGNDLTQRFPLIVGAVAELRASSCILDGEAVACGEDGISCFELLLRWDPEGVFMYAST